MRTLAVAYCAACAAGAVHAVRTRRPARFAGIRLPGEVAAQAVTVGTPLSPPPVMLGALVLAVFTGRKGIVKALAATFVVGVMGEPDTWATLRRPGRDLLATACVTVDVALPAAMWWESR